MRWWRRCKRCSRSGRSSRAKLAISSCGGSGWVPRKNGTAAARRQIIQHLLFVAQQFALVGCFLLVVKLVNDLALSSRAEHCLQGRVHQSFRAAQCRLAFLAPFAERGVVVARPRGLKCGTAVGY